MGSMVRTGGLVTNELAAERRRLLKALHDTVWDAVEWRRALGVDSPEYKAARERVEAAREALGLTNSA